MTYTDMARREDLINILREEVEEKKKENSETLKRLLEAKL